MWWLLPSIVVVEGLKIVNKRKEPKSERRFSYYRVATMAELTALTAVSMPGQLAPLFSCHVAQ